MKMNNSQNSYNEIEHLVDCALDARTKKEASPYIDRLSFLHRNGGYKGYTNIVFGELISAVNRAAGAVSDKDRLCGFARTSLFKLQDQMIRDNGEI